MTEETITLGQLDVQIIRCLQLSPRVPFRTLADVLGVSEQTVARRYRALRRAGLVRVTAVLRPTAVGMSYWLVRVQCRPSGAESLANALAQRDDIGWVSLMSGGAEVVCVVRSRTEQARDDLLMQRLPRTAPVLGLSAAMVVHRFVGADLTPLDDWTGLADRLTAEQEAAVLATADLTLPATGTTFELQSGDLALVDALLDDGRASYAALASATGSTEGRVTRRLRALIEAGAIAFDVDLSMTALGLHTAAHLWMTASPSDLHRVGTALAQAPEVTFAAAVTGPQNLVVIVACRDVDDLYRFTTDTVGGLGGVLGMEISPVLRSVKQAGTLTDGSRLTAP